MERYVTKADKTQHFVTSLKFKPVSEVEGYSSLAVWGGFSLKKDESSSSGLLALSPTRKGSCTTGCPQTSPGEYPTDSFALSGLSLAGGGPVNQSS